MITYTFTAQASRDLTANFTLQQFTITFVDADGTELQSGEVEYGKVPAYEDEEPAKSADDEALILETGTFRNPGPWP